MSFEQSISYANNYNNLDNLSIRSYRTYTSTSNSIIFNNNSNHRNKFYNHSNTLADVNRDNVYYKHMDYVNSNKHDNNNSSNKIDKEHDNIKDDIISLLKNTTSNSNNNKGGTKNIKTKKNSTIQIVNNSIDTEDLMSSSKDDQSERSTIKENAELTSSKVTDSFHSNKYIEDYLIFLTNGKLIYSSLLDYYNTDKEESDISLEISVLTLLLDTLDYSIINLNNSEDNSNIQFYYDTITPNIKIIYRYKSGQNSSNKKINLKELDKLLVNKIFHFEVLKKRLTKFEGLDLRYDLDFKKLQILNKWVKQQHQQENNL
ncbi:hypothetical protein ACO0SA_003928 [Hanseniaspora valbyensis]